MSTLQLFLLPFLLTMTGIIMPSFSHEQYRDKIESLTFAGIGDFSLNVVVLNCTNSVGIRDLVCNVEVATLITIAGDGDGDGDGYNRGVQKVNNTVSL